MREIIITVGLAALLMGVRAGVKSYKKRGKFDGMVIADAIEAATDEIKE